MLWLRASPPQYIVCRAGVFVFFDTVGEEGGRRKGERDDLVARGVRGRIGALRERRTERRARGERPRTGGSRSGRLGLWDCGL
jgi:hypothetical protein